MGGSIPLPALGVHPPQQPDILGQVAKLRQIQGMGQEQQLRQQQIESGQLELQIKQRQMQDQQTIMQVAAAHNGSLLDALPELAGKISAASYIPLQKGVIDTQKAYSDKKKIDLENEKSMSDQMLGLIQQAKALPPDQYQQAFPEIAARALQIDPRIKDHVNPAQPIPQQALDGMALGYATHSQIASMDLEKRQAAESQAKLPGMMAESKLKEMQLQSAQNGGAVPGVPLDVQEANSWLRKNPGKGLSDYVVWKAKHSPTMLVQGGFGQAGDPLIDMVGKNQIDLATALQRVQPGAKDTFLRNLSAAYPNYNQGNFGIEKKVGEKYTSGNVSDQLMAINTAREHMKTFQRLADALDNGNVQLLNKVGNEIGVEFGSDKATNMRIAAQAFGGEVGRAFDGAGVVASERKQVEEAYKDSLSKGQFRGAIQTVDELLAGKQRSAKQSYDSGKQAKPNFGEQGAEKKTDFFSNLGGAKR